MLNYSNFILQINKLEIFDKNSRIAVGVSGGVDSITLVYLLSRWAKIKNFKIIALIVDHKLRTDSSIESKQVSSYLSSINIKNKILTLKNYKIKGGIQANARSARLKIIQKYCLKNNIIHLFYGHHLNDNLETFVLRKVSGSNIEGLNSINFLAVNEKILIIRPLLNFSRNEIKIFAIKNNLNWIEDPSNKKMIYSRSIVRSIIFNNKKIENNLINELKSFKGIYNDYNQMINIALVYVISFISSKYIELDKKVFSQLPPEIALKVLVKLVGFLKNDKKNFKYRKLLAIYKALIKKTGKFQTQKTLFLNMPDKLIIFPSNKIY